MGSEALGRQLAAQLEAEGRRPYVVPVGGSSAVGTWGYLQAVEELLQQSTEQGVRFDDIVMVCICVLYAVVRGCVYAGAWGPFVALC